VHQLPGAELIGAKAGERLVVIASAAAIRTI
jgi:hypothetical protein